MTGSLHSRMETTDGVAHPRGFGEFRTGWLLLVGSLLGVGVGMTGLPFFSFGIFMKPLIAEFGWTRAQIGTGMLFISSGKVVIGPFLGPVIDRFGVRLLSTLSLVGLGFGFLLLSFISADITTFYLAWIVVTVLGSATTPLTWTRAVSLKFIERRGLALGTMLMGTGVAAIVAPPLLQYVIATHGWRGAYLAIALFVALVVAPFVWFSLRSADDQALIRKVATAGMSRGEALRTRQFWTVGIAILVVTLGQAAVTVHLPLLLSDSGFGPGVIATTLAAQGISLVIGRVVVGYIIDRVHAPLVAGIFFALPVLALTILFNSPSIGMIYAAAMLFGLASGAEVDLLSYFVGRYFGLRHYGAIYGVALVFFGVGAGLGPMLTGAMFDHFQSYDLAILCGIVLNLGGAALIATMGKARY